MTAWVVGAGGLLGSAVVRALRKTGMPMLAGVPTRWGSPHAADDLVSGLHALVRSAGSSPWQVFWCAGVGVTSSPQHDFDEELRVLSSLLDAIGDLPLDVRERGSIVYASSAGGVYGGATDAPFNELSDVAPLGAYGSSKLAAEASLERLSARTGVRVVAARIANVYGPGQSFEKQQGLITRLCLSAITRTPLSLYVSLDTIRDYIYVDDCARRLVRIGERLESCLDQWHVKVVSSGRAVSVAALVAEFRRVSPLRPLIVFGSSPTSALQRRDLRLESVKWTDIDAEPTVTLPEGIARTAADLQQKLLRSGLLPVRG